MATALKVTDLASPCLTRPRGGEAYNKLCDLLAGGTEVEVDLDAAEAPSTSFLDELVCRLRRSGLLRRVTFVTRTDRVKRRLSEIAAVRQITVYFKPDLDASRRPAPKTAPHYKAEYEFSGKRALV